MTHPLARRSQNLTVLSLDAEANTGPENRKSELSDVIYVIPCERRRGLIEYVISLGHSVPQQSVKGLIFPLLQVYSINNIGASLGKIKSKIHSPS